MPDFGAPVAQGVQAPSFKTLSDIMGLRQQQLDYQKAVDTYSASVARTQADSSLAQTNASVASQTADSKVAQQKALTGLDQFKLTGAHAQQAMQLASGMIGDPDFVKGNSDAMVDKLNGAHDTMVKQFGIDPKIADATITTLKYQALHSPQQVRQSLINMTQQQQGGAGQQTAALPSSQFVSTGNTVTPVASGNPALTGGIQPGVPQGAVVPMGLPPTTPVMRGNTPGYAGDPNVQAAPAIGQVPGIEGPVAANNAHFGQVQQEAAGASNRIAGLENIRQELPNAWSGGGDAGNWIRRLGQVFGNTDRNTAQDLIAKNLSQIASQGGATDAARTLTEMGSPGVHVTKDAATEAVSQLMGVEAKKQAASAYFSGTPTNSPDYANKMTMWSKYADPRAFQYAHLSPEEQAAMKAKMKKAGTWGSLNQSMSHLAAMGVEP